MTQSEETRLSFILRLRDRADEISWKEFNRRYGHMLYRYARSRGASHIDAEDLVQEVTLQFFKALDGFEYDARKGRFRAYLRVAVLHAMSRRADKQSRQPTALDPNTFDYLAAEQEAEKDHKWEMEWRLHRLRWAMQEIAPEFEPITLKAFEMHVLADRSVLETAERLEISKWRVYRARKRILERLKDKLSELDPTGDV